MAQDQNGKEPVKYEKNAKGNWVLTQAWKDWRDGVRIPEEKPHKILWKEVASTPEKTIYFCACKAVQGNPYSGCGAIGIRHGRHAAIQMVQGPTK